MYNGKTIDVILEEQLTLYEMPSVELQVRLGLSRKDFKSLMDGQIEITKDIATKLSHIFVTPINFWFLFNQEEEVVELQAQ